MVGYKLNVSNDIFIRGPTGPGCVLIVNNPKCHDIRILENSLFETQTKQKASGPTIECITKNIVTKKTTDLRELITVSKACLS